MNRARAQASLDDSFDRYMGRLIDVLMSDINLDPSQEAEFIANFHRGLAAADHAHARASVELDKIFKD